MVFIKYYIKKCANDMTERTRNLHPCLAFRNLYIESKYLINMYLKQFETIWNNLKQFETILFPQDMIQIYMLHWNIIHKSRGVT